MTQEYGIDQQVHQHRLGSRVVRYALRGVAVLIALLFVATSIGAGYNAWAHRRALAVAGIPVKLYTVARVVILTRPRDGRRA